jgi:hypothetical protein
MVQRELDHQEALLAVEAEAVVEAEAARVDLPTQRIFYNTQKP